MGNICRQQGIGPRGTASIGEGYTDTEASTIKGAYAVSSKRSPAARILEFFTTQPIGEAKLVFGLVREVVRKREQGEPSTSIAPVKRRTRRPRVNAKPTPEIPQGEVSTRPRA